jgi:hypothetical protein
VTAVLLQVSLAFGIAACGTNVDATLARGVSPALHSASFMERTGRRMPLVYVADHKNNVVDVFDRRGQLQYTITSGLNAPVGLFVDARHNLWVANPGANNVLVFPHGSTTPIETISDSNQPNDVAVCRDGTAFIADSLNVGGIGVYPRGHTTPTRRLEAQESGSGGLELFVTCDEAGNIFATGFIGLSPFTATTGWHHGWESGYYLLPQDAWSSSGIKASRAGTLLIAKYAGSRPAVVEFTEAGKPTGSAIDTGSDLWSDIALSANQNVVFGADTEQDVVVARKFPKGAGARKYTSSNLVQPEGVAIDDGD